MNKRRKCKDTVMRAGRFESSPCGRNAMEGSEFCGQHDPKLRAARKASRPPTKAEIMSIASRLMVERLDKLSALPDETVSLLAREIRTLMPCYAFGSFLPPWAAKPEVA